MNDCFEWWEEYNYCSPNFVFPEVPPVLDTGCTSRMASSRSEVVVTSGDMAAQSVPKCSRLLVVHRRNNKSVKFPSSSPSSQLTPGKEEEEENPSCKTSPITGLCASTYCSSGLPVLSTQPAGREQGSATKLPAGNAGSSSVSLSFPASLNLVPNFSFCWGSHHWVFSVYNACGRGGKRWWVTERHCLLSEPFCWCADTCWCDYSWQVW